MKVIEETILRIEQMESYYDCLCEELKKKKYVSCLEKEYREMFDCLIEYYEGGQWLNDFEADEKGFIPHSIKRGILSEDTLYDFFNAYLDIL